MEFKDINNLDKAQEKSHPELIRLGLGILFVVVIMLYAIFRSGEGGSLYIVAAAVIGAYMAMNIGANDVANNVGPAVGSHAMTLGGALIIAAVFEAAGAIIAGGEVVGTIRSGIIDGNRIPDKQTFIWLMMAALLASALWLNAATAVGAPVSTTHSIVGAVMGAGIAAAGMDIVAWGKMGQIAASWVISPVLGGLAAAGLLFLIKRTITYQTDKVLAARTMVPWLMALMGWSFATYILLKGVGKVVTVSTPTAMVVGLALAVAVFFLVRPVLNRHAQTMRNDKAAVNDLFTWPLIFAAALLSFAHGSNDVANAVGPLAAIVDMASSTTDTIGKNAPVPLWVMMIGALGLSVGLALYGPKLIRTVGSEITELDKTRAYCIAMSATLTVIVASEMGLPVSSTHIAVGAVFGVGFLREYLKNRYDRLVDEIKATHPESDQAALDEFLQQFKNASVEDKGKMLRELKERVKTSQDPAHFSKPERKNLKKVYKRELVKRSQLMRIAAAWVITVPASALLAALVFFMMRATLGA
ncbi:MAG TPA: inorganic phosphate transporter [Burkholderiaceae bacterium]|jgi:PiT family inorganic phosphate transporter|nr:inorganic phosphate transporter [Burkholderiaceae bacterium]